MIDRIKPKIRKRTASDLVLIACLFVSSYILFVVFNAIDWLHELSHSHSGFGLAELLPTFFIMSFGFAVFAFRRWQEVRQLSLYTEELSMTDPMTNLPNRRAVSRLLNQVNERQEYPVAIVLVQLQGLEDIRSNMGLSVAEHMLIELLYWFSKELQDDQLIAYWQAGQFVVFCPNHNQRQADEVSERLMQVTANKESLTAASVTVSCVAKSVKSKQEIERVFHDLEDALF